MTVLATWVADQHERLGPTCLYAPDGETSCGMPATHRLQLAPLPQYDEGPVTFACAEHEPRLACLSGITATREVHRAP